MTDEGEGPEVVVAGFDGSHESSGALSWACRYAAATGATLRVVTAWHDRTGVGGPAPIGLTPDEVGGDINRRIRDELAEAVTKAWPDAPAGRVETKIDNGHPAQVLVDESEHAGLLVVGSRGHGGFASRLVGSVSTHCVNHAFCPVVVVR